MYVKNPILFEAITSIRFGFKKHMLPNFPLSSSSNSLRYLLKTRFGIIVFLFFFLFPHFLPFWFGKYYIYKLTSCSRRYVLSDNYGVNVNNNYPDTQSKKNGKATEPIFTGMCTFVLWNKARRTKTFGNSRITVVFYIYVCRQKSCDEDKRKIFFGIFVYRFDIDF